MSMALLGIALGFILAGMNGIFLKIPTSRFDSVNRYVRRLYILVLAIGVALFVLWITLYGEYHG